MVVVNLFCGEGHRETEWWKDDTAVDTEFQEKKIKNDN